MSKTPETPAPRKKRGRKARNVNRRRGKGFTHLVPGGPPAHAEATKSARKQAEIIARQQKAWALFIAGATFEQVGKHLGVSNRTAWHDCVAARDALLANGIMENQTALIRQLESLRAIHLAHWPKRQTEKSAKVLLEVHKREARLLGLDAPPRQAPVAAHPLVAPGASVSVIITMPDNGRPVVGAVVAEVPAEKSAHAESETLVLALPPNGREPSNGNGDH